MSQLEIRTATQEDIELILNFILELAKFEKLEYEFVANAHQLHQHLFVEKYANVIIGSTEGMPVCFALYFFNYSTFLTKPSLYLEDLFVLEEYRHKGYGTIMLKYLANIAIEKGCGRMEWSVLDWNQKAIQVYNKIGAKMMDEWTTMRMTEEALVKFTQ